MHGSARAGKHKGSPSRLSSRLGLEVPLPFAILESATSEASLVVFKSCRLLLLIATAWSTQEARVETGMRQMRKEGHTALADDLERMLRTKDNTGDSKGSRQRGQSITQNPEWAEWLEAVEWEYRWNHKVTQDI